MDDNPDDYVYYEDENEAAGYTPDEVGRINLGRLFRRSILGRKPSRGLSRNASPRGGRIVRVAMQQPQRLVATPPRQSASPVPVTRGNVIQPGNQRVRQLGFAPLVLAIGGSGQVSARVLKAIQAQRLIISVVGVLLDEIQVTNIRVGVDSQLAGTGGLPAAMFERDAIGSEVQWAPAQTGSDITLDFINLGAAQATVLCGIYGIGAD